MKKVCLVLAVLLVCLSVFTGCSQSKTDSKQVQSSQSTTAAAPAAAPAKVEKVKISFWTLSSRADTAKKVIADFMTANPNIEVAMTPNSTDDQKKNLKVAASSGTLPDAWFNWGGSLASFYPENGLTLDLTSYAEKNKWSDRFSSNSLEMCKFNGQLSGMPTAIAGGGLYYDKAIFEKYKIKVPATVDELEAAMKTLKDNGITPISTAGKFGWLVMRINQALIEDYAGKQLHDDLLNLKASWNNPAVIKMYTKLKEWSDKGYYPQGYITMDPAEDKLPLYAGQAAMVFQLNTWDTNVLLDKKDPKAYGFFHFPIDKTPSRVISFVEMIQFSKKSAQLAQDAALKFAEFFYGDAEISKYNTEYRHPMSVKGAKIPPELVNLPPMIEALNKNGAFLIGDQALPQEVISKFFQTQDEVVTGSKTPEQAAKFMDEEIAKYKAANKK